MSSVDYGRLPKRIAEKVAVNEVGCWVWMAYRGAPGYGRLAYGGRAALAHRVVWEILRSPIPDGYYIDHLCLNKACVNPDHLEPVTPAENLRRAGREKTVCSRGHPYVNPQYVKAPTGVLWRRCRECAKIYNQRARAKRKLKGEVVGV